MRYPVISALVVTTGIVLTSSAFAVKPPGVGEDETAANNLSVPAIFVPTVGMSGVTCTEGDDTLLPVLEEQSTVYLGYWLQGEAVWQADCDTAEIDAIEAGLEWGDNLTSAPLKQRTPIRVEVGLLADAGTYLMTGFEVDNLTPDELDRNATYGTDDGGGIYPYPEVRVWDADATLLIESDDGEVVYDGLFGAEINATGRVVYGYNWQKPLAGDYTFTFYAPDVELISTDAGTLSDADLDGAYDTVTLEINVASSPGGGGGGGSGPPDGKGPPADKGPPDRG